MLHICVSGYALPRKREAWEHFSGGGVIGHVHEVQQQGVGIAKLRVLIHALESGLVGLHEMDAAHTARDPRKMQVVAVILQLLRLELREMKGHVDIAVGAVGENPEQVFPVGAVQATRPAGSLALEIGVVAVNVPQDRHEHRPRMVGRIEGFGKFRTVADTDFDVILHKLLGRLGLGACLEAFGQPLRPVVLLRRQRRVLRGLEAPQHRAPLAVVFPGERIGVIEAVEGFRQVIVVIGQFQADRPEVPIDGLHRHAARQHRHALGGVAAQGEQDDFIIEIGIGRTRVRDMRVFLRAALGHTSGLP